MAGPASDLLVSHRVGARAREIGIDLPHEENHAARDFFAWVFVRFKWLAGSMAVTAVDFQRVAEVVHDRTVTVNPRIRGKHFQIYARRDSRRRSAERFVPVEELSRRFRFRLHAAPMTGEAIHFVIPGRKNARAGREERIDLPYQCDHLARRFFLGILVARKIALHVAVHALDAQRLTEILHYEPDIRVRREGF